MPKPERVAAPEHVQIARKVCYGGARCVVTGEPDAAKINWHHLDGRRQHSDDFTNFVPINAAYNQGNASMLGHQERAVFRASVKSDPLVRPICLLVHSDLTRDALLGRAQGHYKGWRAELACGATRLAYYRDRDLEFTSHQVLLGLAAKALFYGRNRLSPAIPRNMASELAKHYEWPIGYYVIDAILNRELLPPLGSLVRARKRISAPGAFEVLRTISGIFAEHGHVHEATRAYDLITQNHLAPDKDENPVEYGAYLRREAMSLFARSDDPTSEKVVARVLAMLDEVRQIRDDSVLNLQMGTALFQAWICCIRKEFDSAFDLIVPFVNQLEDSLNDMYLRRSSEAVGILETVTPWNVIEILQLYVLLGQLRKATSTDEAEWARDVLERIQARTGYYLGAEMPVPIHGLIRAIDPCVDVQTALALTKRRLPKPILDALTEIRTLVEAGLSN
jgi:hypothetical protein